MDRYQPARPSVALVLAAVAMSAVTVGLLVVAPASVEASAHDAGVAQSDTLGSLESASDTAIDLVALHEEETALLAPCQRSDAPTMQATGEESAE